MPVFFNLLEAKLGGCADSLLSKLFVRGIDRWKTLSPSPGSSTKGLAVCQCHVKALVIMVNYQVKAVVMVLRAFTAPQDRPDCSQKISHA